MTWEYTFQPRFTADLKGFDRPVVERILAALERIQDHPLRSMKRLKGSDVFSLRVGDYRVYARAFPAQRAMDFIKVGHRSTVHER